MYIHAADKVYVFVHLKKNIPKCSACVFQFTVSELLAKKENICANI